MSARAANSSIADVGVVVVTYNALPWLERALEGVRGVDTIVVDNGSTDGTVAFVQERFPDVRVLEQDNRGLAAGWNTGVEATSTPYVFLLNADAWLAGDVLDRLVAFAEAHPDAAVVGPRLLNVDGTLQRSVRGFPTPWRLATEYFFLRKLAPGSRALNAFYAGGFDHDTPRRVESVKGAALLVRRDAIAQVGPADEGFFFFSEETDWCYRFRAAGWTVWFCPEGDVVHVGGAAHAGRLYTEQLRGHLRFLWKHRGAADAERARRLLIASLRLRGLMFRGARGRAYREGARFLASGSVPALLER